MGNELTVIGRAHEYVREYSTNGYNQIKAYMVSHKCNYESASDQAYRFHKSPAAQEAFQKLIGTSINEYFRSRDGVVLEAQSLLAEARKESLDTALKCLKFIAELMGHININKSVPGDTNIDNRSINISNVNTQELKNILNELKEMNKQILDDNGRQKGKVEPSERNSPDTGD